MPRTIDEILSELRDWIRLRGDEPKEIIIPLCSGREYRSPFLGPARPGGVSPPLPHEEEESTEPIPKHAHRHIAILQLLEEVGHRLTATQIAAKMLGKGIGESPRTIQADLTFLVNEGTLDNKKSSRPPGYGLPEWETT